MSSSQSSRWLWVVLLVGCNAKLQLDPTPSAGDGGGGSGASDSGGGGPIFGSGGYIPGECGGCPYFGGSPNFGGAPPVAVGPGVGEACIPGGSSIEEDGSPAKTAVVTLDRCGNGLSCDATKHCMEMPACPQSAGSCVVYAGPLADPATGGFGGATLNSTGGAPSAGATGAAQAPLVAAEHGVTAMAADDTHLYWVDYGTRDGLGNYKNDGTLYSYGLADSKTTTLAKKLPGPNAVGITSGHVYVAVDGGALVGSVGHPKLLRLPLTGGTGEVVQEGITATSFASVDDQAFWSASSGVYTILPTPGATASIVDGSTFASQLSTDANDIYYANGAGISSVPLAGGTPNAVASLGYAFAVGSDAVYGAEPMTAGSGLFLDTVPKTGGTWGRTRALGSESVADRVQIVGDRYFVSAAPPLFQEDRFVDFSKETIETGVISTGATPLRLVEVSSLAADPGSPRIIWTGTATTLFWADGGAIFSRSVTGK